jgi:hypothetical protein
MALRERISRAAGLKEVGLKESENVGVGGARCTISDWRFQRCEYRRGARDGYRKITVDGK